MRTKLADYYLRRIQQQVGIRKLNRNDKGYELARELNNLKLPLDEAKSLMQKYADEAPDWIEKEPYILEEAFASLRSAYNNKRESPWIPWGFKEDIEKEKEVAQIRAEISGSKVFRGCDGKDLRMIRPADIPEPEDETPTPIDLSLPKVFKGFIQKVAELYGRHFESPYEFWIFAAATYLGNLFCNRVRLNSQLFTEPRIYMAGIGPSAVTRKSESQRQLDRFFKEYWDSIVMEGDEPERCVYTCNVGSAEGLISFLKSKPNSIYFLDELKSFIQKSDIKGSNLLQIVNSLFEDTKYENITKDSHLKVENAHLSFIGFSTDDTWESMFSSNFTDIGFINRLWIVPGKSDKYFSLPEMVHRDEKIGLFADIARLLRNFPDPKRFPELSPVTLEMNWDARWKWDDWYRACPRDDFTKRLDTYGLRFMQIMCISEDVRVITQDIVERVIELLEWQRRVRRIYYPIPYDTKEAKVEGKIMRKLAELGGKVGRSELYNAIRADRVGSTLFNKALKNLSENMKIVQKKEDRSGQGRPKEYIYDITDLNL